MADLKYAGFQFPKDQLKAVVAGGSAGGSRVSIPEGPIKSVREAVPFSFHVKFQFPKDQLKDGLQRRVRGRERGFNSRRTN